MWYCASSDRYEGPYSEADVAEFLTNGLIDTETLVWRQGMTEWLPLKRTELAKHIGTSAASSGSRRPPPPPSSTGAPSAAKPGPWSNPPDAALGDRVPFGADPGVSSSTQSGARSGSSASEVPPPHPDFAAAQAAAAPIAGVWRRAIAFWVDGAIVSIMSFLSLAISFAFVGAGEALIPDAPWQSGDFIGGPVSESESEGSDSWRWLFVLAPALLYHGLLLSSTWQATIGKRLIGVYVARDDGRRVNPLHGAFRYACTFVSSLIFYLGYLIALTSKDRKTLHDMICGTKVHLGRLD